ncbi:MAG TPA: Ppx/GppA phosphatase family protein [Actinomycetota bacterium]|nr:Ppx/GppA phosphatase family protein [Actinomycetota bacterium]
MRLAVLDVGSNTVHLVVVDGRPDGTFEVVTRERDTLRLAEAAFPSMTLPDEAVDRLVASVARMRATADELRAGAITGFATSAIREARNGLDVLGRVREATGVTIKVLPGVEEARLTYLAARRWTAFSARRLLVLDIGGGSLEVAGGEGERPELAESLPLGATRLTRRFVRSDPVRPDELVALRVHALALLGPLADRIREAPWEVTCATSKTFRNLGAVARALPGAPTPEHEFGFAGVDGQTAPILTREALNVVAGYLAGTTARDRRSLTGLDSLRAGNVVAGSQVAALVMQAFGLPQLVLAPWALREGVILETLGELGPAPEGPSGAPDPRRRSVLDFARRHAWDEAHCRHVTALALSLFDQTTALHGLGPAERELLEAAGLLHDVGYAVAQSARHKHSLYLIRNAALDGWSPRELLMMANVARYHRKALPSERHGDYMDLEEPDRVVVRRLAALLRVAEGLDADHFQVVEQVELADDGDELRLELRARDTPDLWAAGQNADLFEAEFGRPLVPVATEVV